jgi:hypothetical protein
LRRRSRFGSGCGGGCPGLRGGCGFGPRCGAGRRRAGTRHGTGSGPGRGRLSTQHLRRNLGYRDELDVEDEIRLGRNAGMLGIAARAAVLAVGQLPGNEEAALATNVHAVEALIESGNEAAEALGKDDRLACEHLHFAVGPHFGFAIVAEDRAGRMIG